MLKALAKPRKRMVNIRILPDDLSTIKEKAKKYTNNNVTAWIIFAATKLAPSKKDLA